MRDGAARRRRCQAEGSSILSADRHGSQTCVRSLLPHQRTQHLNTTTALSLNQQPKSVAGSSTPPPAAGAAAFCRYRRLLPLLLAVRRWSSWWPAGGAQAEPAEIQTHRRSPRTRKAAATIHLHLLACAAGPPHKTTPSLVPRWSSSPESSSSSASSHVCYHHRRCFWFCFCFCCCCCCFRLRIDSCCRRRRHFLRRRRLRLLRLLQPRHAIARVPTPRLRDRLRQHERPVRCRQPRRQQH